MTMGTMVMIFFFYRWTRRREPEVVVLPPTKQEIQQAISTWFAGIAGDGVIDCDTVGEHVETGRWIDLNQGHAYLRQVKTKPHFYVSVHHKEHDLVRWQNIFEKGDDNEHKVRKNFEYILGESNAQYKSNGSTLPVVVDIGGNVGYYSLLSAAWKHAVVTFEINPTNVVRLCESLRFNREPMHVRIHRLGVSNTTGARYDIDLPSDPGAASLDKASKAASIEHGITESKFSVSTVTLDDFAKERKWFERKDLSIALLKLDTEGHEGQILQGAKKFFRHRLAKNVILEYRSTCREAATILLDAGYVIVDDAVHAKRMLSRKESEVVVDALAANKHVTDLWFRQSNLPLT